MMILQQYNSHNKLVLQGDSGGIDVVEVEGADDNGHMGAFLLGGLHDILETLLDLRN